MAAMARLLPAAVALAQVLAAASSKLAVFGYVPEYRFGSVNWTAAVASTTHLILFSVEPTAEGDMAGFDAIASNLHKKSDLFQALQQAGKNMPSIMFTIGGAGRSNHFADMAKSRKLREKLAKLVGTIFEKISFLGGVDLDWESPQTPQQWRDLGKLAKEIRGAVNRKIEISMTYHPRSGAAETFSALKAKSSGQGFADLFDYFQCMSYSQFDNNRKHSTVSMDKMAIDEWTKFGMPTEKLILGMPFFGVHKQTGEARTYSEILTKEPSLADRAGTDESIDGVYFVNARSMAKKVRLAAKRRLGGVMIWELGQDIPGTDGLLQHVWTAARDGMEPTYSWREMLITRMHGFNEDHFIGVLASIIGGYLLIKVLTVERPRDKFPPPPPRPPPKRRSAPAANGHNEGDGADGAEAEDADEVDEQEGE